MDQFAEEHLVHIKNRMWSQKQLDLQFVHENWLRDDIAVGKDSGKQRLVKCCRDGAERK